MADAMTYFCFSVEPKPQHAQYYEIQAGWAHVVVKDDQEATARAELDRLDLAVQSLTSVEHLSPEQERLLPPDTRRALRTSPIYVDVCCYETGGGPEQAGELF